MVFLADAVLSNMLNFIGGGHYVYIGGVSSQWRTLYSRISQDKDGNLVTSYSAATASISTLEYAVACGLALARDAFKLGNGVSFGPGVYEWARERSYPLLVWVAMETSHSYNCSTHAVRCHGNVLGVYTSVEVAKALAAKKVLTGYGLIREDHGQFGWRGSGEELTMELGIFGELIVKRFAVEDVDYATEVEFRNRLPMYVLTKTEHGGVEDFRVANVYGTREAANREIDERIARARAHGAVDETDRPLGKECSVLRVDSHGGLKSYRETYDWEPCGSAEVRVEYGCYLDYMDSGKY